ncbi:HK97 family phage prohead protease [Ruthenibacterium lactatiformans]|uniref:HK97 family phage prohead protease n=1 Tax=Ruthenibacterium lactatiformans TaxID=1550024 RepID=UPI003FD7FA78
MQECLDIRKGMLNFKMAIDYDCSGWATKANTRCYDGLTIAPDAFKECDGKTVPMVYNHDHSSVDNVIGHCLLKNRPQGVYCYAKFNDTDTGRTAKACVENGDLNAFSIYANGLQKVGKTVKHGFIREVSLVLAGCNPGALIDEVVKHSADEDYDEGEAFIYNDEGLSLTHGLDPEGNPLEELTHSADDGNDTKQEDAGMADEEKNGKTLKEVYNSMTDEQKECCHALVGLVMEAADSEDDGEEDTTVKQNVFDRDTTETVLKHSIGDINAVIKGAKSSGTMKAAFENSDITGEELAYLSHGIDNVEWLFPDDKVLDNPPRIIDKDQTWVGKVMSAVHHIPFSRFKSMFADLTEEDARAKGYIKGNFKKEQVFGLLRRSTSPTTVYKKQKMDRDDVIDITSFDVIAWLKSEMRLKLNEEIARAILIGDGRPAASEDKVDENCIRPVFNDADLFTIKVQVSTTGLTAVEDKYKAAIKSILRSRKEYKGAGTPTLFTTEDALTEMLLLEDTIGHTLYADEAALARKLRVSNIVTVPQMEGMKGAKGGDLFGIIVNLSDYTVGADKGGAVSMFDDFDIDFNAMKYLIETRCSGALTTPYSAIAVEWAA